MRLDAEAAGPGPHADATAKQQAVAVTGHVDTSAQLGLDVVGLAARAKGLEVRDAVGAVGELENQVKGSGHVALEAIDHQLRANGRDGVPDGVLQHRVDEDGIGGVLLRTRIQRALPSSRRVPAMVDKVFQRLVGGVAPCFPEMALGHDLLQLLGGFGDG